MTQSVMNEDWLKSGTWDLWRLNTLITTVPDLLWALGKSDAPLMEQQAAIEKFTKNPSWIPAPQELKDAVAAFLPIQFGKAKHAINLLTTAEILKGDVPGHDFHGNQYTSSAGIPNQHGPAWDATADKELIDGISKALATTGLGDRFQTPEAGLEKFDSKAVTDGKLWSSKGAVFAKDKLQHDCHGVSLKMALSSPERYQLVRGYGLSKDGMWRSHTFIQDTEKNRIIEPTPIKREAYFGAPFTPDEVKALAPEYLNKEEIAAATNTTVTKGDTPGHDFHGNQWTGGTGGGIHNDAKSGSKSGTSAPLPKEPLPNGWKIVNKTTSRTILESDKGNRAEFATRSRGWKPGERLSNMALQSLDKFTTGKTLNFAPSGSPGSGTFAFVQSGNPDTINLGTYSLISGHLQGILDEMDVGIVAIATASAEAQAGQGASVAEIAQPAEPDPSSPNYWDQIEAMANGDAEPVASPQSTGTPDISARVEELQNLPKEELANQYDQIQNVSPEAFSGLKYSSDTFLSPQMQMDSMIAHELGHSDFFAGGQSMQTLVPILAEASAAANLKTTIGGNPASSNEFWQSSLDDAAKSLVYGSNPRISGFNFGGGVVIPRADVIPYLTETGQAPIQVGKSALQALGTTEYGTYTFQEFVAETRAAYEIPQLPKTDLTMKVAEALGWNTTAKSATMGFMKSANAKKNDEGVVDFSIVDTLDGPGIVIGNTINVNGVTMTLDEWRAKTPTR